MVQDLEWKFLYVKCRPSHTPKHKNKLALPRIECTPGSREKKQAEAS